MRRLLLASVFALSSCSLNPNIQVGPGTVGIPAITIIENSTDFCTAWSVDDRSGTFVTAEHCEFNEEDPPNIEGHLVHLIAADKGLALWSGGPHKPTLKLATTPPKWGDEVLIPCYAAGSRVQITFWNRFTQFHVADKDYDNLEFSLFTGAGMGKGCSGGPVLNRDYEVIGVAEWVWLTPGIVGGITPLDTLYDFLKDLHR